jgi:hypothetical protein
MKSPRGLARKTTAKGFIALISVIIISVVLLALASTLGSSSLLSRFDTLNSEFKRVSLGLAESCTSVALLRIGQNYAYDPTSDPGYVAGKGSLVVVGVDSQGVSESCYIESVTYGPEDAHHRKPVKIETQGQYRNAFTNVTIAASVANPSVPVASVPPTCAFSASPSSILMGQSVTLQWSTAGVATLFTVLRSMGGVDTIIYSGSPSGSPISDIPSQSATYTATITGPGGSSQCVSPQAVFVQPSLSCADTVIILAGGMSSGDRTNEGNATKSLLNLYSIVAPHPLMGVGSYGGLDGSAAQVPAAGQLTDTYGSASPASGLYGLIDQIVTTVNSSGGTDLAAGITRASDELTSIRHVAGHKQVLIFVSDGKPIDPGSVTEAVSAALSAADSAKQNSIEVFGVHFGTNAGRDLIAELSNGVTPYPGHQNGSYNDAGLSNNQTDIDNENADSDDFFISPTSAAMAGIFDIIGKKVCPAAIPPPPPPPPPPAPAPSQPSNIQIGSWEEIPQ